MIEAAEIKKSKKPKVKFNPFPGLRPFTVEESHLFFGREGQSDEVLKKLAQNRFTAVIGSSGSGKSSLMYCGIIPTIHGGFITDAGSSWKMVVTRPGNSPINNMAKSIVVSEHKKDLTDEELAIEETVVASMLRKSSLGLIDTMRQLNKTKNQNILIVIDQFEELFRFKKTKGNSNSANESIEFVKLFLEAVQQTEVPIYVVLTMRSDFIGDCAQFPSLTEKINDSHYLIPQMTRDDLQAAIEGPVAVGGGKISPHLVQQLLNEVGDNPDQLPILQHALMRTWNAWEESMDEDDMITIDHYESIGRMEKALSNHANECYSELSEDGRRICENLFKTLTEKGGDNRGIRRPIELQALADICHAPVSEVKSVIENFRKAGRSFLAPSPQIILNPDTIVDISHESLMRIWDRLIVWVDEEATAVQTYIRIAEAAAMYQVGQASLWRPPDLQLALNWKEKKQPTLKWAERYDPSFERAIVFLQTSKDTYEAEEKNKILQQKKALQRSRIIALVFGAAAVIALFLTLWAFSLKTQAEKAEAAAIIQTKLADEQRILALQKEKEALSEKKKADEARLLAEEEKKKADEARLAAEEAKNIAIEQERLATIAKEKAVISEREAQKQKAIALEQQKIALEQKEIAEKAQKDAYALRMLSISKAMAVKSTLTRDDTTKKALLAYQSYVFNDVYKGETHNADVYDGLYYTLKYLNPEEYNSLKGHTDAVRGLSYDKYGNLFSISSDGKLLSWKGGSSPSQEVFKEKTVLRSVTLNNSTLAIASENAEINVVDASTGTTTKLKGHTKPVWDVVYDSKGNLFSTSEDSTLRSWNGTTSKVLNSGKLIRAIDVYGDKLAGGLMSSSLIIWDKTSGSILKELKQDAPVYSVAFSNDGKMLACGDEKGGIKIYDENYELVQNLTGHTARVHEIKFNNDGSQMATASFDGSVLLWKTSDFNVMPIAMKDHTSWVWTLAFSPDGDKLIAGCRDNLIRVWPTNTEAMAEQICSKISRNMSRKEWNRYVADDIPYEKTCNQLPLGEGVKEEDLK